MVEPILPIGALRAPEALQQVRSFSTRYTLLSSRLTMSSSTIIQQSFRYL
jgi:hypothetical protein